MNIRRIEHELFLYRISPETLEEINAELEEMKSYTRPNTGKGRKSGVPDVADQVVARDYRIKNLKAQAEAITRRQEAVEAALTKYAGHEYMEAVKRIYMHGHSVRMVAKDMKRDWRTVDRHARQLLCQIGATLPGVGGL